MDTAKYDSLLVKLRALVAPPAEPIDIDSSVLPQNEEKIGLRYPSDILRYAQLYGSGMVSAGGYTWEIWSPYRLTAPAIISEFARIWSRYRDSMETHTVPLGLYPEPGGLLPFATTPNGDWVCWKTNGSPESWPVVDMTQYEAGFYDVYDFGMLEYMVKVLSREVLPTRLATCKWIPQTDIKFRQDIYVDQGLYS